MKPLVSAAAAVFLLAARRRPPDPGRDGAGKADAGEGAADDVLRIDGAAMGGEDALEALLASAPDFGAAGEQGVVAQVVRGLRVARRAAGIKAVRGEDGDLRGLFEGDTVDVRPLLAVSVGVTLFLLTRASREGYSAEVERAGGGVRAEGGLEVARAVLEQMKIAGERAGERARDRARAWEEEEEGEIGGAGVVFGGVSGRLLEERDEVDWLRVSDMRSRRRNIVIVTTAALPWMTGTAVNPLLRAVYLAKAGHDVTLVVPWLESPEDQRKVFPKDVSFATQDEQRAIMVDWAKEQVPDVEIKVRFYEGVYSRDFGSIMPLGDVTAMFADDEVRDVCVLEEPEHLTWHHTGARWTKLFEYCVGIIHTCYTTYARENGVFGVPSALFLNFLNKWVCRSYCHRVIKLSDAVQALPHSVTCNVHGVRDQFLEIGRDRRGKPFANGAYFLGKMLWAKGYTQLVENMEDHFDRTGEKLPIDMFGSGPDLAAIKERVRSSIGLSEVGFHGIVLQHHSEYLQRYKVFVNPSMSDVVCTATAEALAMGKWCVVLKHPSNDFFSTFENCLVYETPQQFSAQVAYALAHEPKPLSAEDTYRLSWEAATERFYDSALLGAEPVGITDTGRDGPVQVVRNGISGHAPPGGRVDSALAATHKTICATLVATPASMAVRQRYRAERKEADLIRRKARRLELLRRM